MTVQGTWNTFLSVVEGEKEVKVKQKLPKNQRSHVHFRNFQRKSSQLEQVLETNKQKEIQQKYGEEKV